ncbi:SPT3 Dosage dependent suppressor of Ty-induced promoter mutations-like protein [Podila epigama]|nr:SPT3 Dosage dependent suppressor of Ty-induced promoter mutations-like protein [Podila epigama]
MCTLYLLADDMDELLGRLEVDSRKPECSCGAITLQIEISGIPAENGKCRVETQLKIALHLKDAQGATVKTWKQLRLPHAFIAKEKHRMEKFSGRDKGLQETEILTLDARLVCDHDMTKILETCDNCIGRERKRAHRRKEAQKLPGPLTSIPVFGAVGAKSGQSSAANGSDSVPPTPTDPEEYLAWEKSRIMSIVFLGANNKKDGPETYESDQRTLSIQFTARDSTGAVLTTVLTNPVMMMDDHKSGKKAAPATTKTPGSNLSAVRAGSADRHSALVPPSLVPSTSKDAQSSSEHATHEHSKEETRHEHDMEMDLESGQSGQDSHVHHISENKIKLEDVEDQDQDEDEDEFLSGDVLSALGTGGSRMGGKRRVTEDALMEDVQMHSPTDALRGPFRRKTSHDVSSVPMSSSPFSSSFNGPQMSGLSTTASPFMPGSPFAQDDNHNSFSPSFSQALAGTGSMLNRSTMDMYMNHIDSTSLHARNGSIHQDEKDIEHERLQAESASMMESFTTLDESMSSPSDAFQASSALLPNSDQSLQKQEATAETTNAVVTSGSDAFSISTPIFSHDTQTFSSVDGVSVSQSPQPSSFTNPEIYPSPFTATFSSPMNGIASSSMTIASAMSSSFLDASQMQEFQNFKRQSIAQKQQQAQLLSQLQQGLQQFQQKPVDASPVPWTTASPITNKDPLQNMKTAMAQTTSPASSAFLPTLSMAEATSSSTAVDSASQTQSQTATATTNASQTTGSDTSLGPKKRGRPRKAAVVTQSEANSPVMSTTASIPNLSPSPHLSFISDISSATSASSVSAATATATATAASASAAAAAAAQFMMYRQQQQQQQQQHQQQLQQQQKQAILARQKPRVQKLIPSRGPVEGGSEITLLGSGFYPGMIPTFDGVPALNVQYYGPETVICRLPPRGFPGTVVVKAHTTANDLLGTGSSVAGTNGAGAPSNDGSSRNDELVRTMAQLFGGPATGSGLGALGLGTDDDAGVLFEYEESKGDRDLIALALQVLGMKMNGRVEPPHQVAMRIMGTAATSNTLLTTNGHQPAQIMSAASSPLTNTNSLVLASSTAPLQLQQLQQQQLAQQQEQQQQQQQQQQQASILQGAQHSSNPFQPSQLQFQQQRQQQAFNNLQRQLRS